MSEKRDRGKNFTDMEREQLIEICLKYTSIIENKKTDKYSTKEKNMAWNTIKEEYNSIQITGMREVKTLKGLYDGLKMKARKEKTEERVEVYKTGGGAPASKMTPLSLKIVGQLETQFQPLTNPYDSSSALYNEVPDSEELLILSLEQEEVVEEERAIIPENLPPISATTPQLHRKRKLETAGRSERSKFHALEHAKKMKILEMEEQAAQLRIECEKIKLENAKKEQVILDFKLKKCH